ncbi:MAG TPA: DUF2628 domain-containing protein [Methylotenera sp.]|nr:DUF2628 domain-containing protein [Methylotenera sp.]HPH04362.1 DUF2628 domain-containing protein [Methylotenera sp.]HPM99916.1 DUF2628 domain-containing protein [Methylotenera sp.]
MYCQKCGTQNDDVAKLCSKCGAQLNQSSANEAQTELTNDEAFKALIGDKNQDYYLNKFNKFEADGKTSATWHWPAFFVTFFWLLYRKMWPSAALYYMAPTIALIIIGIISAIFGAIFGFGTATLVFACVLFILFVLAEFLLAAMYADAVYYKHCKNQIARIHYRKTDKQKKLEELVDNGGTSSMVLVIGLLLAVIPTIGILAAIAIPAYQDYVVKAQVAQAYSLEKEAANAVSNYYRQHKIIPETLSEAGFTKPVPPQVGSLTIVDPVHGTIGLALMSGVTKIGERTLLLIPSLEDTGEITWTCRSNIDKRYSPPDCVAF